MSNLIIKFPTDEEEEANLSFTTYSNYLKAIVILISDNYCDFGDLIKLQRK